MSRGMGRIQLRIAGILNSAAHQWFSVDELCDLVFPGMEITVSHRQSVRRALRTLAARIDLQFMRIGRMKSPGWCYRIGVR